MDEKEDVDAGYVNRRDEVFGLLSEFLEYDIEATMVRYLPALKSICE